MENAYLKRQGRIKEAPNWIARRKLNVNWNSKSSPTRRSRKVRCALIAIVVAMLKMETERMKVEMEIGKRKRRTTIVCNKSLTVKYRAYSLSWPTYRRIMASSSHKINSAYAANAWKITTVIIINYAKTTSSANCAVMRIGKCAKMNFANSVSSVNYVDYVITNNSNALRKSRKTKSSSKNSTRTSSIIRASIVRDENIAHYLH